MDFVSTMAKLESLGTEQYRKVYARHGAQAPMFGVSFAHLGELVKQIKHDQPLAEQLWQSGNHDARILATMIADPATISEQTVDAWALDVRNYVVADALSKLIGQTPFARAKGEQWSASDDEWIGQLGWNLIGLMALSDRLLADEYFLEKLSIIESGIHSAMNRKRHAMNGALIGIGLRNPLLQAEAMATARRIGKVEVDHGETDCKTPDAAEYILRAVNRRISAVGGEKAAFAEKARPGAATPRKPAARKKSPVTKKAAAKKKAAPARKKSKSKKAAKSAKKKTARKKAARSTKKKKAKAARPKARKAAAKNKKGKKAKAKKKARRR